MLKFCVKTFLEELQSGVLRAAFPGSQGNWIVNVEVKEKILAVFRYGESDVIEEYYIDRSALFPRKFSLEDKIRVVPFGSAVRSGAYVSSDVVIMPPSYVNIGAYIGRGTMVDSHVLVGSCAQIGENVHLSAGVSIGGVLEPVESVPVIVEDYVFIGAGCVITSGFHIKNRAVLGAGLCLSRTIPIYDTVKNQVYHGYIPENAVVLPGARDIENNFFDTKLALQCGVIVKYRDDQTNSKITLEDALRL
ncbi:2,3,4,5-tetrahydropyridine-2,6-dicarboxylate N-succinyltransferase [Holospora obtusa F1]|uniref:2,3,4,5-tetrahydropyridine-2,6-dicarboxylate N-succinyltransferase n=1 Tax=Holospora obtusa F1 TaxID=1399147 RepID=W6TT64_HOLOB|nr:2,3,4,5-tetrahydropyridine-2,6-dicarboxylate N-succinyltransferase [Holospora obtusa]ETZ06957.1 2,3,4,5-tetrahydropyridine-2,6-dicarboxylate N-succinyltransferase [Holospora obtusa F1]